MSFFFIFKHLQSLENLSWGPGKYSKFLSVKEWELKMWVNFHELFWSLTILKRPVNHVDNLLCFPQI